MRPIDWESKESHILINPYFPAEWQERTKALLPRCRGHIWLTTSGSTRASPQKSLWVALGKKAFLTSAEAVNRHLAVTGRDRWFNALSPFHVGGLSIWARAHLAGVPVISFPEETRWCPGQFCHLLNESRATLTSLVPSQVMDLVQKGISPPPSVRAVIVGGARLAGFLYTQARNLGWPLLPSFGMTEACSQVATAPLSSLDGGDPRLLPLPHMDVRVERDGFLTIRSESLFSTFARWTEEGWLLEDPKEKGWWKTQDLAELRGEFLHIVGRGDDLVKIGGELVSLPRLEEVAQKIALENRIGWDFALVPVPDERLGAAIYFVSSASLPEAEEFAAAFRQRVMPYEKIRSIHWMKAIPRTALGKVKRTAILKEILGNSHSSE